jgi:hypothetical protein
MRGYTSAVKNYSQLHFGPWHLQNSDVLRRTLRYLRHTFPGAEAKGVKFPVTMALLARLAKLLPGWPNLAALAYDDLLWLCLSVVAVSAFLRGGEFLVSGGDRPTLMASDVSVRVVGGRRVLVVSVPQPKTRADCITIDVPCFVGPQQGPMAPVRLWQALYARGQAMGITSAVAFPMCDGKPASRAFATTATTRWLSIAGITVTDVCGRATSVKMASWRAGAVTSAVATRISESMIKELGRWRSDAWRHYLLHSPLDLQGAGDLMWREAVSSTSSAMAMVSLRVGASITKQLTKDDDDAVAACVLMGLRSKAQAGVRT